MKKMKSPPELLKEIQSFDFLNSVMTQLIPAGIGLNSTRGNLVPKPTRAQVPSLNIFETSISASKIFDSSFIKIRISLTSSRKESNTNR